MQSEPTASEAKPSTAELMTKKPLLSFASYTIASERHPERNEDTLVADQRRGLAGVFDGVGGSSAGEIASQLAASVIKEGWKSLVKTQRREVLVQLGPYVDLDVQAVLQQLILDAHEQIRSDGATRGAGLDERRIWMDDQATTVALGVFVHQADEHYDLIYAYVGDSRVYLLREGEGLKRLSEDDSILTELVRGHELDAEQALHIDQATSADDLSDLELACFQRRNGITQALGDSQPPQIHIDQTALLPGDRILFCTDGIHDNLTDAEIEEILRQGRRTTAARKLVYAALERSQESNRVSLRAKADDMSAVVITCSF